jgi:hypothetical protein
MPNNIVDTGDLEFVVTTGLSTVPLPRALDEELAMVHRTESSDGEKPTEAVQVEEAINISTPHFGERSAAEKKLVRKLDIVVPMMLGITYFFAYLVGGGISLGFISLEWTLLTTHRIVVLLAMPVSWAFRRIFTSAMINSSTVS